MVCSGLSIGALLRRLSMPDCLSATKLLSPSHRWQILKFQQHKREREAVEKRNGGRKRRGGEFLFLKGEKKTVHLQSAFIKVFLIPQSLSWHLLSLKHASLESRSEIKEAFGRRASKMGFRRSAMTIEAVFSVCSLNLRHRELNLCLTFVPPVCHYRETSHNSFSSSVCL